MGNLIFLGSRITADGDCSQEIKRRLLLGIKAMTNLVSILKSRDITLLTKVHLVKAMVFPVVTYECESWTIRKAECRRIDAFELCVGEDSWESLGLQGNQSWIFIRRTDAEVEAPIVRPPEWTANSLEKDPDARKDWRKKEKRVTGDEMVKWHHQFIRH